MNCESILAYASDQFGTQPDYPWGKDAGSTVLRHANRKWYALVIDVPAEKLGLPGGHIAHVLNVKTDPDDALFLKHQDGILPAYHMNKQHWVSVVLNNTVPDDVVRSLIDTSYRLTK